MTIYDLNVGDRIIIKLRGLRPAVRVTAPTPLYRTSPQHIKHKYGAFTEGEGVVISNENKILKLNFVSRIDKNQHGVAEIEYIAIASIYLFQGETTAAAAAASEPGTGRVPVNIYRQKVKIKW